MSNTTEKDKAAEAAAAAGKRDGLAEVRAQLAAHAPDTQADEDEVARLTAQLEQLNAPSDPTLPAQKSAIQDRLSDLKVKLSAAKRYV